MRLTMQDKKKIARITSERYIAAPKKQRIAMLDEFAANMGYNRCYAAYVLRTAFIRSHKVKPSKVKQHRPKMVIYDRFVASALFKIWPLMDYICGKRLAAALPAVLDNLRRHGTLKLSADVQRKLLCISPATIERIISPYRKALKIKGISYTKPGSLLKHQIPVRTFSDWNEQSPGFVEMDLVAHCGGNSRGDFIHSLNFTDVHTTWTETVAVLNKAQVHVFKGIVQARLQLPFPLLGVDSDNGSEFINYHLVKYCSDSRLTFTRSRSNKKNDNCFVEQKNFSIVRRFAGYSRYDTVEELRLLNEMYANVRLFLNFFTPTMKLISKHRDGAKVVKKYDKPITPYQRVLASPLVSNEDKRQLSAQFASVNLLSVRKNILSIQKSLLKFNSKKNKND